MRTTIALLLLTLHSVSVAGYTTPNTGVNWNLDSLAAHSGGTVTGSFPNYILNDTLTLSSNDRLTFLPGSVLSVTQGSGKGVTVFGILHAVGTLADSIIVKGSVDSAGWYRGFRIEDSAVDSACVFFYCKIMNAAEGIHCLNSSPTITNCFFTKHNANAIRLFAASPTIRNCVFTYNRQSAITANSGSSPLIESNIFSHNNYQNTGPRNAIALGGQGTNSPTIRGNEIYNQLYFRAGAIGMSTLGPSDVCNPLIEDNYLHDNSFGIATTAFSPGGTIRPMIRNNHIENNRINPDPMISGSGITMQAGGATNAPIITGNIIRGNYWGITCVSSTGLANSPQPNIGNLSNADTSDDGWNVFENNNNSGVIYQLYNNGTQNIFAQNNYWGTADSTTIEQWIVHRPDSTVFGSVSYGPWGRKGLGTPDSFAIARHGVDTLDLHWTFPTVASGDSILILHAVMDSTQLSLLATVPGDLTSYSYRVEREGVHYFGLSSRNRFGDGDTTFRSIGVLLPSVHEKPGKPSEFSLEQNYPNPFNPSTTIRFAVAESRFVSLKVFDVVGREVATLVSRELTAGNYETEFDATNLSSGVYCYRLQAGEFVSVRKLAFLR